MKGFVMIYLIRHAKPDYSQVKNTDPYTFGILSPLAKEGEEMAKELTKKLPKDNCIILSSPYTRALQTAYIFAQDHNVIIEHNLHEWLPSKNFNITVEEYFKRDIIYKDRYKRGLEVDFLDIETKEEMVKRFQNVLDKYKNTDKDIYIFAHSRLFAVYLENLGIKNKHMDFCEIKKLDV